MNEASQMMRQGRHCTPSQAPSSHAPFPRGFAPARRSAPGAWPAARRSRGRGTPRDHLKLGNVSRSPGVPRRPRRAAVTRHGVVDESRPAPSIAGFRATPARSERGSAARRLVMGAAAVSVATPQTRVGTAGHFLPAPRLRPSGRRVALVARGGDGRDHRRGHRPTTPARPVGPGQAPSHQVAGAGQEARYRIIVKNIWGTGARSADSSHPASRPILPGYAEGGRERPALPDDFVSTQARLQVTLSIVLRQGAGARSSEDRDVCAR